MYFLKSRKIIITFIILCSSILAFAQEGNWTGFTACYQTRDLYKEGDDLWISTLGGALKFDTITGEKEVLNTANSGLISNFVTCIYKDSNANYWFGTDMYYGDFALGNDYSGGLHKWSADGQWSVYNTANSELPSNTIQKIIEDQQGNIWVLLERGGILQIISEDQWEIYNKANSLLTTENFTDVKLAEDGTLWFTGMSYYNPETSNYEGGGLFSYDGENWTDHSAGIDPLTDQHDLFNLDIDSQGNIWMAASYDGYYCYDGSEFTAYQPPIMNPNGVQGSTREIVLDDNDVLHIGSTNGFYVYNGNIWRFYNNSNSVIQDDVIDNILIDGNDVWLGGYYYGLFKYSDFQVTEISTQYPGSEMPSIFTYDVEADNSGKVWIASGSNMEPFSEDGLVTYQAGVWEHFGYFDFQNTLVNDIFSHGDDLYLATGSDVEFGGIIAYADENWNRWDYINGYPYVAADKVMVDSYGLIWSLRSNPSGGIAYYNGSEWNVFNSGNSGLTVNQVNDLAEDLVNGLMWFGTSDGIFSYDPISGNWEQFSFSEIPNLVSPEFPAVYVDHEGALWAGSQIGLYKYQNGTWENMYDILPLLPNGYPAGVTKIIQDEYNCYWISTVSGLIRYDGEEAICFNTENSQLPTNVINSICSDLQGNIWISTPACGLYRLENNFVPAGNDQLDNTPQMITEIENYPNPFNPVTTISFQLKEASSVSLEIFNQKGQKVRTLLNKELPVGTHKLVWDGRDMSGRTMASGIYFYKIRSDKGMTTRKMCLMK